MISTDNKGARLMAGYNPSTRGLTYNMDEHTLTTADFINIIEVLQTFAKAYGMK